MNNILYFFAKSIIVLAHIVYYILLGCVVTIQFGGMAFVVLMPIYEYYVNNNTGWFWLWLLPLGAIMLVFGGQLYIWADNFVEQKNKS